MERDWSIPIYASNLFKIHIKLIRLKKDWNKTVYGNAYERVRLAKAVVQELELRIDVKWDDLHSARMQYDKELITKETFLR